MKRSLLVALVLGGLAVAWLLLLAPGFLGGPASYTIVAGDSMEPVLSSGDLVVTRKQGSYHQGDIVVFRVPEGQPGQGAIVVHRIVDGSGEEGFVMQGDSKDAPDLWRPRPQDVLGKMWLHVPGSGQFLLRLREPVTLGLLAGGLGMLMVLGGGDDKKRPREVSSAKRPDRPRRLRLPPGLALWLLLIILTATLVASLAFTARH